jgi:dihydroorotate dehydrogenase electron transfer subunit
VTDLLTQVIHDARTDVIYACGPMGMLRAVTVLAGRYDIPVQALVEESMACGTGVCMTCVLPVVGEDGVTRMTRSCVDGPVFRGDLVRWDDIGTIPFDALGAPGWNPPPRAGTPREPPAPPPSARPQGGRRQSGRQAEGRARPRRPRAGPAAGRSGRGR